MSDTPRTDSAEKHAYQFKDDWTPVCESKIVRKLELELNAANQRIKRLEEAGGQLMMWLGGDISASNRKLLEDHWNKAKEDKL